MRLLTLIALCGLLAGCVRDITIRMEQYEPQNVGGELLARVKVNDLRAPAAAGASKIGASSREAAFGVPMGNITFDPTESQLVKNFLEIELTRLMRERGMQAKRDFSCDVVEFRANTDTTPLYWDVIGRIQLVLKQDGKEYGLSGTHTERTYAWPGEAVVKKAVDESLNKIIAQLTQVKIE